MSRLANAFQRRQHRRDGSDTTVSSYELENDAGASAPNSFNSPDSPMPARNTPNITIKDCQNVKVGEQNTNYFSYNNYFLNDKTNPAFTLSDKTISSRKKLKYILRQSWFWAIVILIILLCMVPTVLTNVLWPSPPLVVIIFRNQWATIPQKPGMPQLSLPVKNVIVAQTGGDVCTSRDDCTERVQQMLLYYEDASLPDIPYNFMIGDDGFVYEGRGFHFKGEIVENEFSSSFNDVGLIIAFIGTFNDAQASEGQLETFRRFLLQSVSRDVISRDYTLLLQDQLTMSAPDSAGLLEELGTLTQFHYVQPVQNRAMWNAADPKDPELIEKFTELIIDVQVSQSAYTPPCLDQIFDLQEFDFDAGTNDILENFLITPCGIIEGRGWDTKPDSDSLVIMVIGEMQPEVLNDFLFDGTIFGKLSIDANIDCAGCTLL